MLNPVLCPQTANGAPITKMKTSLVIFLVPILCYVCRAQKHDGSSEVLLQTRVETDQTLKPRTEAEGAEQELELQSDIWAELRALRDMVVEQKVELRHLTTRVTAAESLVEELTKENLVMETRMMTAESLVAELTKKNTDMETRMTTAESLAEELQMENDAQAAELEDTQQKLSSLQQRLTVSESRVEELEKQQEGQNAAVQELYNINAVRKVGFSASLRASGEGNTGCMDLTNLVYKYVITNTGNHYNPVTGYFTAPVRGVYYFSFTGHVVNRDCVMRLDLVKNGNHVMSAGDRPTTTSDAEDNATNDAVLQLEVGDVVSVRLVGNVWDDHYHRTTFSGFLLFPL